jgi:ADP-ribosylglycohydrolase
LQNNENVGYEITGVKDLFQIRAVDCLACVMYSFFRFYENPVNAVVFAASMGGDTDTIAKITGDLCGALYGVDWIPKSWRGVENESKIIELGEKLYKLSV